MKCKHCDAQLEDGLTVCPVCGKENELTETLPQETAVEKTVQEFEAYDGAVEEAVANSEEKEVTVEETAVVEEDAAVKEKGRPALWKLLLMGVGVLAAVILFVGVILKDQGIDLNPFHWFGSQEPTTGEDTGDFDYGLNRDSYTAAEDDIAAQAAKIAAKSANMELTNGELQVYYWSGVYDFVNQYQYYLESMGLDLKQPLDAQSSGDGTWQKFFLENAISNWHKYSALAQQAKADGYVMSQEQSQQMEDLTSKMEQLAQSGGYESVEAMLTAEMGPLCTLDSYLTYMENYYLAVDYFNAEYAKMRPSDAQVEDYFTAHEEELASSGITKDSKAYDVRHILIKVEGGTTDEAGLTTYTDAEWEACRMKAQQMLDQWKSDDGTEEGFAELAKNHSADGGSRSNGGLYSGLTSETNFVQEFKDWYLDASRATGDTGLVKSTHGYHIMYFSGANTNWQNECFNALVLEMSKEFVEKCMEDWPVTVFDDDIAIGNVTFKQQ